MATVINNKFSFSRFGLLLRKDLCENKKMYILGLLSMCGIITVVIILCGYTWLYGADIDNNETLQGIKNWLLSLKWRMFFFLPFSFGLIISSFAFRKYKDKTGRIDGFMLPASILEKYISIWFLTTIVFNICYIVAYIVGDIMGTFLLELLYPECGEFALVDYTTFVYIGIGDTYTLFLCLYIFYQSFFFLGSILMPKLSFLKSSVPAIGIFILLSYLILECESQLEIIGAFTIDCGWLLLAVINYVIAYFCFKKKELC